MLDRATGRRKPPWFLGSLLGFVAVMVYAQQAVFEIVRAGIAFF